MTVDGACLYYKLPGAFSSGELKLAGVVGRGKGGWGSKSETADSCAYLKPNKTRGPWATSLT